MDKSPRHWVLGTVSTSVPRAVGHPTTNWKRKRLAFWGLGEVPEPLAARPRHRCRDKAQLQHGHASSVPIGLHQPSPAPFSPPSLLPGLPTAGLPARPPGRPSLVATRKIPGKYLGPSAPGQQDPPLLRAVGVRWAREETCSELCVPRNPGSGAKYLQSQAKHPRVCLEQGSSPLRIAPHYFPRGAAALCEARWWRALSTPPASTEQGRGTSDALR